MQQPAATESIEGDVLVLRDTFKPNAKQRQFWRAANQPYSEVEEVLFDGAIRGGKTQAGAKLIVAWAMRYGGTYVISRFSYRELEDSTKKVCLYGDGALPPAIPPQLIATNPNTGRPDINETHNRVRLVNGAEILFRALEPKERGKVRNLTASGWFIDQAEELEGEDIEDFYQEIKGRCSDPRGPRKLLLVANPGATDHLLHTRFIDPITRYGKTARIHVTIHDNRDNIPYDYYLMLLATEHTNSNYFRRMVMGEWGVSGGQRFKTWDERIHVCDPFDVPAEWTFLEGIDYGWSNPTVWLSEAIDFEGSHWVVAEHHATETDVKDHAAAIKALRANDTRHPKFGSYVEQRRPFQGNLEPSASWLDPSAWNKKENDSVAMNFLQHGIYAAKAVNERIGGWNRLGELLNDRGTASGYPRLRIFRNCDLLIKEIPNLKIKLGTDDVEKVNDHASDALRYVEMSQMPPPEAEEDEPGFTREEHMKKILTARSKTRSLTETGEPTGVSEIIPAGQLWFPS